MTIPLPHLGGVEHRFVDLPSGLRVHVAEAGDGDPVVLLHGWPEHWWAWRRVIPGLAAHYRLICPDLRGFGWSDAPDRGYETEQLAEDVVQLLDALELGRVRIIGHDWGGFISFLICLHHPEHVERYIALNTPHPFPLIDARTIATFWRFWYQFVIATPGLGPRLVGGGTQWFMRFLDRWNDAAEGVLSAEDTELFQAPLREPARAQASSLLYRTFLLGMVPFLRGRYKSLRLHTPTLLLNGTRDPVLREALMRGYEPYADDMTLEFVEDCGHLLPEERPEVVLRRAIDFFAGAA